MTRRLSWLVFGVGVGFWLSIRMARAVRRAPRSTADRVVLTVRDVWDALRDAALEGRDAMLEREAELRAELAGRLDGDAGIATRA